MWPLEDHKSGSNLLLEYFHRLDCTIHPSDIILKECKLALVIKDYLLYCLIANIVLQHNLDVDHKKIPNNCIPLFATFFFHYFVVDSFYICLFLYQFGTGQTEWSPSNRPVTRNITVAVSFLARVIGDAAGIVTPSTITPGVIVAVLPPVLVHVMVIVESHNSSQSVGSMIMSVAVICAGFHTVIVPHAIVILFPPYHILF